MMYLSLILLIVLLQSITVYLDNKSSMLDFFESISSGKVAGAYTRRGMLLTLSRTVFYVVPPLLGVITKDSDVALLFNLCIAAALINLFFTFIQGVVYNKIYLTEIFTYQTHKILFKSSVFSLGLVAFIFFLITPYLLNILALYYPEDGIWIVQLNHLLNSIFVFYLIFVFEPQVSKKIDHGSDVNIFRYHVFLARLYGRLILCIILFNIGFFYEGL